MTSAKNLKFENDGKVSEYAVQLDYANDFNLSKVNLKNVNSADNLEVSYSNWTTFESTNLPTNVKILIKGTKTSQIMLENTKFDSSKMETPYSVPNNYTKTEIR